MRSVVSAESSESLMPKKMANVLSDTLFHLTMKGKSMAFEAFHVYLQRYVLYRKHALES